MERKELVQRQPILFVCTHNVSRSYTAEHLFQNNAGYDARSAGTSPTARVPVTEDLIGWAGQIFAMEEEHITFLRDRFPDHLEGKKVVCLGIPDIYSPLETELIALLCDKLASHLTMRPEGLGE